MIRVLATGKSFGVSNIKSVKNWSYDSGCSHTGPQDIYLSMPDGKKAWTELSGIAKVASTHKRINVEFEAYEPDGTTRLYSEAGIKVVVQYKYVKNGKMCLFIHTMNCTAENNEILPDAERQVDYINFEHIVPYPLIDATAISVKVINNSGGPVILREVYFSSSRDISAGQAADQITSAASITSWRVHRSVEDPDQILSVEFIHTDDEIDTVELYADQDHNLTAVRINNGTLITGTEQFD